LAHESVISIKITDITIITVFFMFLS